jgi:hypothetical protein
MNPVGSEKNLEEVQGIARALDLRISRKQAEQLLHSCSPKIEHASKSAIREVIREVVEKYWLDEEDKKLT